jgi:hypothetical protein
LLPDSACSGKEQAEPYKALASDGLPTGEISIAITHPFSFNPFFMNTESSERNLGSQPLGQILQAQGLKPNDLVLASAKRINHKMVSRAVKGRRLTAHSQQLVLDALNATGKGIFTLKDLFNYGGPRSKSGQSLSVEPIV